MAAMAQVAGYSKRIIRGDGKATNGADMFRENAGLEFADGAEGWLETAGMHLAGSGISIWRVVSSGHRIELPSPGNTALLIPKAGKLGIATGSGEWSAVHGDVLLMDGGSRQTRTMPGPGGLYEAVVALFPGAQEAGLRPGRGRQLPRSSVASLLDYLVGEMERPGSTLTGPAAQRSAAALLREHHDELHIGEEKRHRSGGVQHVLRAEEIMAAHHADPLSIAEVARQLDITPRSLQLAFQRHRGFGPREALNRLRMEAVRDRLLAASPNDNVSRIALECGFAHLGRFAVAYREMFGERPSDTLKRRR